MSRFSVFLKLVAPVFFLVGALHLFLGLNAEVLLGARISAETLTDPAIDSQNRFYGVAFTLYGVLLFLCATDPVKYSTVLRCVLWTFFAAGLARFFSLAAQGSPPLLIWLLLCSELLLPPLIIVWLNRVLRQSMR